MAIADTQSKVSLVRNALDVLPTFMKQKEQLQEHQTSHPVVILAKELTTAKVGANENCDPAINIEIALEPIARPISLHMLGPLDLPMERDASSEDIVLVEDVSNEEEAKTKMDVFVEDPMDVIILVVGHTQPISDITVEEPKSSNDPPTNGNTKALTDPPIDGTPNWRPSARRSKVVQFAPHH